MCASSWQNTAPGLSQRAERKRVGGGSGRDEKRLGPRLEDLAEHCLRPGSVVVGAIGRRVDPEEAAIASRISGATPAPLSLAKFIRASFASDRYLQEAGEAANCGTLAIADAGEKNRLALACVAPFISGMVLR